ncbi:hypothetical protein CBOM_07943 [Ceraceosorus bombacis]|uniref:Uncharacterized protein n=1 Tax=Ceraceosorus bombacis TaxID=401625 RepID=A0A0P1BSR8_9BASI|nr:hypothetical protein CBOM_07943 [Ceraceosorus bombacis]
MPDRVDPSHGKIVKLPSRCQIQMAAGRPRPKTAAETLAIMAAVKADISHRYLSFSLTLRVCCDDDPLESTRTINLDTGAVVAMFATCSFPATLRAFLLPLAVSLFER